MGKEWLTNRNEDNIPHPSFNVGGVKETNFLKKLFANKISTDLRILNRIDLQCT